MPAVATGCLMQSIDDLQESYTPLGDKVRKIYRGPTEWQETDALKRWLPRGEFQGDIGACNAFTTGKIWQACAAMLGLTPVKLSYNAMYWALNGGRSYSAGTLPEESLQYMLKIGCPLLSDRQPRIAHRNTPLNAEERAQAQDYRFDEAHLCDGVDEIVSAIMAGFYVDGGIMWFDTDGRVAPDGRLPVRGYSRWGPGGHSVVFWGVKNFPTPGEHGGYRLEAGPHVAISNHHGDSDCEPFTFANGSRVRPGPWGLDGIGYIPLARLAEGARMFAFWALRGVRIPAAPIPTPNFPEE